MSRRSGSTRQARLDDDAGCHLALTVDRNQLAHEVDEVGREERIVGGTLQGEREALGHLDIGETHSVQLRDEDTLRQGSGYSPGPGGGMRQDFGRDVVLDDREIGDRESAPRAEHAGRLREYPALAGGEIDRSI
jgi:hypothetical protein